MSPLPSNSPCRVTRLVGPWITSNGVKMSFKTRSVRAYCSLANFPTFYSLKQINFAVVCSVLDTQKTSWRDKRTAVTYSPQCLVGHFLFLLVSSIYMNSSPKRKAKMAEIKELFGVSSSPFLLFLSARLTQSWQGVCRNFVFRLRFKE
jgi:hypothetical protein